MLAQDRLGHQVGRPQVEAELLLELVDRRLVDLPPMAKPPTRLTRPRSGAAASVLRPSDDTGDRAGVGQIGLDELESLAGGQPLELPLGDPRDDDAPPVAEQSLDHRRAEPTGPSSDDCGAVHGHPHSTAVRPALYLCGTVKVREFADGFD